MTQQLSKPSTAGAGAFARIRGWMLLLGPAMGLAAALLALRSGSEVALAVTVAVTVCCATWWIFEPVPAPITALLPLALFPMLGVLDGRQVAESYGHPLILLLAGGFMISRALESSGAHRRLALGMVRLFGGRSGRSLVFGFIAAAGLVSMWISNTATTLMLLPVALAVLQHYPDPRLKVPLVLAIAYAASIGGLGTPIGSPPNLVFMQVHELATGVRYGFLDWMAVGVPVVLVMLPVLAWWLTRRLGDTPPATLPPPPAWEAAERRVLVVFALTAVAWVTRTDPFGGWTTWLGMPGAGDASVALLAVVALAILPDGRDGRLLDWETASSIPWGALVLFGGGIALAAGFEASGLSAAVAAKLGGLGALPLPLLLLALCTGVVLLSEIASNTATAVLMMPILAATAPVIGVEPALLMFPAVLAASIGFMLPVATAPNAIAYGAADIDSARMLRAGAFMDLAGIVVVAAIGYVAFSG